MSDTKKLTSAIRQYRHNDNGGFVFGYDINEADRVIDELVTNNDVLTSKVAELKSALCEISNMCIGNLTMSYSIDPDYVGNLIYQATGMTNPELNESVEEMNK